MYKEVIICITILVLVIIGHIVTQNSTSKAVEVVSNNLNELREELIMDRVRQEKVKTKMSEIKTIWNEKSDYMAYYVEHDELEKVETELTKLKADIETEEYTMGVENLDNCVFILEHIKDKNALKIVNIF